MDKNLLNLIAERKKKESIIDKLLQDSFEQQINFIKDSSGRKVALCTRRAGKSYSDGLMMCITGLMYPKSNMVFATMTMATSKDIMVKDIINPINDKYNLNLELVGYKVKFPNDSIIHLFGVNKDEQQKNKLLGKKNKLFILDEAQDITVDIPDLIERVVDPSLLDNVGQFVMNGTPSDNTSTYFYEITQDYKSTQGWSFHRWNCLDNPYVSKQIIKATQEKENLNPLYKTTDVYRQMWLGEWVISKNALIYKPGPQNFDVDSLPGNESDYIWLLGIDLGYVDADGFVIGAYSLTDKCLYFVEAFAQKGNDDVATAMTIKRLSQRINFNRMVIDGSNLKAVETMRQRWQLPLIAADKAKKADYIRLFNMDLQSGVIKILPRAREALNSEWKSLIWDPKKPGKEKAGLDNHCSDAALYLFRAATNWASITPNQIKKTEEEQYIEELSNYKPKTIFEQLEDRISFKNMKDSYD